MVETIKKTVINIKKLNEKAVTPTYGSEYSAGADLYACLEHDEVIAPGETTMIHTGISMEIPVGYAGFIYARSGLATGSGLAPANKVGVVDSDYRGECMIALYNHSNVAQVVAHGERIAQMVIAPVLTACFNETDALEKTARGEGSFGSTGTR